MLIETERLTLHELTDADAPFILALLNEPSFKANIGDRGVRDLDGARGYIRDRVMASYSQHGFGMYRTELKESGAVIGLCGLVKRPSLQDVDIGYALFPAFWGKGYASEGARAVLAYGREVLNLGRIVGIILPENKGSARVLEAIGLRFQETVTLEDGSENRLYG